MLTRKQYDLLKFIQARMRRDGVSPSFDEMKRALDLRSKSGVHRLITALEERGFIRRLAHRARAIEILRLPDSLESRPDPGFTPGVIEGARAEPPRAAREVRPDPEARNIPVIGRIAAGTPIEALQQVSHHVGVPSAMLSARGEHYALEVRGDSMIEAGIHEGDVAVIRQQADADTGDLVVALIEDQEATLKRLRRRGDSVALEAANPAYETRVYGAGQVKIQGRMVGLIRTY